MLHFFASWIFHILCRERENISYRVVSIYYKNGKIWKWFLSFNAIQQKWEMLTLYHDYKSSLDYEIFLLYLHEFLMICYYSNKARIWIVYLNNIKISKRSIMNKPKMSYGCEGNWNRGNWKLGLSDWLCQWQWPAFPRVALVTKDINSGSFYPILTDCQSIRKYLFTAGDSQR